MKTNLSTRRLGVWGMCVTAAILFAVSNAFDNYIKRNGFGSEPDPLIATLAFLCAGAAIGAPIMFLRSLGQDRRIGVVATSPPVIALSRTDTLILALGALGAISTAAALHAHGYVDPSIHASASVAAQALLLVIYDAVRRRISLGKGLLAVVLVGAGSITAAGVLERPLLGDLGLALILVLGKAGMDAFGGAIEGRVMESGRVEAARFVALRFAGLAVAAIAGSFVFTTMTGQSDALAAAIVRYAPTAAPLIVGLMLIESTAQNLGASALGIGTPSEVALLLASQPAWALLITFALSFVAPAEFGIPNLDGQAWLIRLTGVGLLLAWPIAQRRWGISSKIRSS